MEKKNKKNFKKNTGPKIKKHLNNFRRINGKKAQNPRKFKPGKKHNIYIN